MPDGTSEKLNEAPASAAPQGVAGETEIKEKDALGHVGGKARHFRISRRDSFVNDVKNGTAEGVFSEFSAVVSFIILVVTVYLSFVAMGNASFEAGVAVIVSFVFAVLGLVFAIAGFKNHKKIRHYAEKRGLIASLVLMAGIIALFVLGLVKVLNAGASIGA